LPTGPSANSALKKGRKRKKCTSSGEGGKKERGGRRNSLRACFASREKRHTSFFDSTSPEKKGKKRRKRWRGKGGRKFARRGSPPKVPARGRAAIKKGGTGNGKGEGWTSWIFILSTIVRRESPGKGKATCPAIILVAAKGGDGGNRQILFLLTAKDKKRIVWWGGGNWGERDHKLRRKRQRALWFTSRRKLPQDTHSHRQGGKENFVGLLTLFAITASSL